MATIERKGNRWRARIRRPGYRQQSRTFETKAEARRWARQQEAALDRGEPAAVRNEAEEAAACVTLGQALELYRDYVLPHLASTQTDAHRIRTWLRDQQQGGLVFRDRALGTIKPAELQLWADDREKQVKPATVAKELGLLSRVFAAAITPRDELIRRRRVYGFGLMPVDSRNPLSGVQRPAGQTRRRRRLSADGVEDYYITLALQETQWLADAYILAIETGCRRKELLSLRWEDIDLDPARGGVIRVADHNTKSGVEREIPLTPRAHRVLRRRNPQAHGDVFEESVNALKCAWRRTRARARRLYESDCREAGQEPNPDFCRTLRWHDLRREAVSRLLEAGVEPSSVAQWSGHQSESMLRRYASHDARAMSRRLFDEQPT